MPRQDFDALVTALDIPFAAARAQRLHLTRGGPRRRAATPGPVKLGLPGQILAAILRGSACPCTCSPSWLACTPAPSAPPSSTPANCSASRASPSPPGRPGSPPSPASTTTPPPRASPFPRPPPLPPRLYHIPARHAL